MPHVLIGSGVEGSTVRMWMVEMMAMGEVFLVIAQEVPFRSPYGLVKET